MVRWPVRGAPPFATPVSKPGASPPIQAEWAGNSTSARLEPALEGLSHWLDSRFTLPGGRIRFGLDAVIGLIPGIGDTISAGLGLLVLAAAHKSGLPKITLARMTANLAIDYVIGSIPILGDLFDVVWKSNQRNVRLFRRSLAVRSPGQQRRMIWTDRLFFAGLVAVLVTSLVGSLFLGWQFLSWLGGLLV